MSRQARLILVLGFVSLIGVVGLGMIAERYRALLVGDGVRPARGESLQAPPADPSVVLSEIDRFIRVRRGLESALPRSDDGVLDPVDPRTAPIPESLRDRLIAEAGMTPAAYRRVREAYRRWRAGNGELDRAAASLFERRRVVLDAVDLGDWEKLDL